MEGPSTPQGPKKRSLLVRLLLGGLKLAVALSLLGAAAGYLVLRHYESSLPDVRDLRATYKPALVTRVLGRDGSPLAELFVERRTLVREKEIPAHVKLAFLAAEDASFYEHKGLNYLGMLRALVVNLKAGRTRQGASTITQQVVKNILLDPERTYTRKIKEALLARKLEQDLSKDEILELYLNHIYLGGGRYGVEEASRNYFGKSVRELTVAEAALLGGMPAGPEHFSPRHNLQGALTRRGFVLEQMERKGFLDAARAASARSEAVRLAPPVETQSSLAPEVVEIVRRTLKDVVGEGYQRGGYTVHTTIDPHLQAQARKAVRENLTALDKRTKAQGPWKAPPPLKKGQKPKPEDKPFEGVPKANEIYKTFVGVVEKTHDATGTIDIKVGDVAGVLKMADAERFNPKGLPPSAFAEEGSLVRVSLLAAPQPAVEGKAAPRVPLRLEMGPQGALVALDVRTREVLALVGSYEGLLGGLDRATQSRRQPGSTFKPVVYSYGLHTRKITAASVFDPTPPPQAGKPLLHLDEGSAKDPIRLRDAVAKSVNPVAQRVLLEVGPQGVVDWAHQLGITAKLGADLSLALGSYEVAPIEMAGVYATFAAGGAYQAPLVISRIVGPDGKEIALPSRKAPEQVLDPAEAYIMTSLLTSVVTSGTGAKAQELRRPVAGKTGTTNQAKDAWFVGYSPEIACAVWTGFDEPRPLGGGKEAGATAALPAWVSFMKVALEKTPRADFARPTGLSVVKIDPATGLRPYEGQSDAIDEVFLAGTEPTSEATPDAGADAADGDAGDAGAPSPSDEDDDAPRPASSAVVLPAASASGSSSSRPPTPAPSASP